MSSNVIAIDGPSASGKSTVARRVASALGFLYVDSGALYRGVTWKALREKVSASDPDAVVPLCHGLAIEFFVRDGAVRFSIDGIEPGAAIRKDEINENVSPVAAMPEVRRRVTGWLRDMTKHGSLVMEGRDIGTAVFPDAKWKFYLDASPDERAKRRSLESSGPAKDVGKTATSLKRRDVIDSTRKTDPLRIATDAEVIDSTSMTIDEVVALILASVRSK